MKVEVDASINCLVDLRLDSAQLPHFSATLMALSISSLDSTNSSTAPYSSALLPFHTSLLKKNFFAFWVPTSLGSNHVVPPSGDKPREKNAAASFASGTHTL